ncbi:hypothetical protein HN873_052340, partial [Arachis hypogaea]
ESATLLQFVAGAETQQPAASSFSQSSCATHHREEAVASSSPTASRLSVVSRHLLSPSSLLCSSLHPSRVQPSSRPVTYSLSKVSEFIAPIRIVTHKG